MTAFASLERFSEEDFFFINWRSCRHCLQSEWPLNSNSIYHLSKNVNSKLVLIFKKTKLEFCSHFFSFWTKLDQKCPSNSKLEIGDNKIAKFVYRTRAIIARSRSETALEYKPRILGLKNEEFPFLVHKLSVI